MTILYQDGMSYLDLIYGVARMPEWKAVIIDGDGAMKELKELKEYWVTKYPAVLTVLWSNQDGDKFFGRMMVHEQSMDLAADTIGELIAQGEAFLRKVS